MRTPVVVGTYIHWALDFATQRQSPPLVTESDASCSRP
jgi:hypothetical protein